MFRFVLLAVVLLLLPAGYFAYTLSRDAVVEELIAATKRDDAAAVSARVDWEPLRASLKETLTEQQKFIESRGGRAAMQAQDISAVVDYYAQPENIDILFYQHDLLLPGVREEAFLESVSYAPLIRFKIVFGYPKEAPSLGEVGALLRDRLKVGVVFGLTFSGWKVKAMELPIFMCPTRIHSQPANQIYGRPTGR